MTRPIEMRSVLIRAACAVAVTALLIFVLRAWLAHASPFARGMEIQRTARSLIGKTEADVYTLLGPPQHVVVAADVKAGGSVDSPWRGMNFQPVPTRPVRNKVLLYSDWNLAAYIFLDERGHVEHVATAGT